ncbi:MAG: hypothetical protein Q9183_005516, partial [Haloplaca sp. 2 TL-2023]
KSFFFVEEVSNERDDSLKWRPVVLCVSFSSKDSKGGKDPFGALRTRVEDVDIKIAPNYIIGKTTHVVQAKRNTAKGLQALINAKHIVTDSFIDALIYATTPTDLDHDESLSPLELDFEKNWPDEMQHVPLKGNEPQERPMELFAPNSERGSVFEGYTFVFCEKGQFDQLQPPITNGGGKAFWFKLNAKQTTTEELVGYVKNVAGEKGLGELEDGSEGKGIVVVKFRGGKDEFEWAAQLVQQASLALDLRFIEQNEFMDAILMNDASVLRRPLEMMDEDEEAESTNPGPPQNGTMPPARDPEPEVSQPVPPVQRRPRGPIKSRFKGFSDDDDDDSKPSLSSVPQHSAPPQSQQSQGATSNTQHAPPNNISSQAPPSTRKRPHPEDDFSDNNEDFVDTLLPAATAMKRRRIEEARLRGEDPASASFTKPPGPAASTRNAQARKPLAEQPIDIKKSMQERRAAADEAALRREESFRQDLDDVDIEAMRDLAVVEEFNIVPRSKRPSKSQTNGNGMGAGRWDPAWNGRKNFKKFRRQGEEGVRRRGAQVIVPLEEVKRKAQGIGEGYWLESESSSKRKRRDRESQVEGNESAGETFEMETVRSGRGKGRGKKGKEKAESVVPRELKVEMEGDEEISMDMIDVEAPRRTRGTQDSKSSVSAGANGSGGSSTAAASLRGRPNARGTGRMGLGRGKRILEKDSDASESEEDESRFRFGKRKKVA